MPLNQLAVLFSDEYLVPVLLLVATASHGIGGAIVTVSASNGTDAPGCGSSITLPCR